MTTSLTIKTLESSCLVDWQDGTTVTVDPHSDHVVDLATGIAVLVSDISHAESPISPEDGEHPPPQSPMENWTERMKAWWAGLAEKLHDEGRPEPPPVTPPTRPDTPPRPAKKK